MAKEFEEEVKESQRSAENEEENGSSVEVESAKEVENQPSDETVVEGEETTEEELATSDNETVAEESPEEEASKEDEASDFFRTWRQRHEDYLKQAEEADTESEESTDEDDAEEETKRRKRRRFGRRKKQKQNQEEADAPVEKKKRTWSRSVDEYAKITFVALFFLTSFLVSLYFISPLGKLKQFTVTGNQQVTLDELGQASRIQADDYALSVLVNRHNIERNIEAYSPWVESASITYSFPNRFEISVKEYSAVAYVKNGQNYHQFLSSGAVLAATISEEQLPESRTVIEVTDSAILSDLGKGLGAIRSDVREKISRITLTPTRATSNLLTLEMTDGNRILIPANELQEKMPYYNGIARQLQVPSTIDMEIGIFSYPIS